MLDSINSPLSKSFIAFDIGQEKHNFSAITCTGKSAISRLYEFKLLINMNQSGLTWLMEKHHVLLGQPCSIMISSGVHNENKHLHGIINEINLHHQRASAHLTIVPLLKKLCYTQQSRIFEKQSHLDIALNIIQEHCNTHFFKIEANSINHKKTYGLDYIVQHQESDFAFVQRLLSQLGLIYYFSFEKRHHIMHITDKIHPEEEHKITTSRTKNKFKQTINQLSMIKQTGPQSISINDYNYEDPGCNLYLSTQSTNSNTDKYIYPGGYKNKKMGLNYLNVIQNRYQSEQEKYHGTSHQTYLRPGLCFSGNLNTNMLDQAHYLITRHTFKAISNQHFTDQNRPNNFYECEFDFVKDISNYQPKAEYKKPMVFGIETATVVSGPNNSPICTDELGRVKIQFHWDINHQHQNQAYIRVMQAIAGKNWGHVFIPRAGQEVWVAFINGDIDRPIIIGSAYNNTHYPPFDSYSSGMCFASIDSDTEDSSRLNGIKWSNESGKESVSINAQRDYTEVVNHNATTIINGNSYCEVKQGDIKYISNHGNIHIQAKQQLTLECGNSSIIISPGEIKLSSPTIQLNPGSIQNHVYACNESQSQQTVEHVYNMIQGDTMS